MLTDGVEDMNFGIIHGNHNIFVSQMKAGDHSLIRRYMLDYGFTAFSPSGLQLKFVPEVQIVRLRLSLP